MEKQIVILGAGAAGLGANYSLKQKGYNPIVLEKDETYGGLCGNFMIAGFRFDRFVHFDFTQIRNQVDGKQKRMQIISTNNRGS